MQAGRHFRHGSGGPIAWGMPLYHVAIPMSVVAIIKQSERTWGRLFALSPRLIENLHAHRGILITLWQTNISNHTPYGAMTRDATFRSTTVLSVCAPFGMVPELHLSATRCVCLHFLHHEMLFLKQILHAFIALKDR